MKRVIIFLMALMLAAIPACGSTAPQIEHTTAWTTEETPLTGPQLILGNETYNGQKFTILTTKHNEWEHVVEEATGEVVNDAIYERNLSVETLLDIDIEYTVTLGNWSERNDYCNLIRSDVLSGTKAYDLITGVTVCVMPMALEGVFLNALDLEYVNTENPWWVSGMIDDIALNGKLYALFGDACINLYTDLAVFYFNKALLNDYGLENPYEIVRDGNWTIDKLSEMVKDTSRDLDGNGILEAESDQFGMAGFTTVNRALITGCEVEIIPIIDGRPTVADLSDRFIALYDKLYKLCVENDSYITVSGDYTKNSAQFVSGKALFIDNWLRAADLFRNMEDNFGIIPYPKFDTAQKSYHTQIGTSTSALFVPITVKDSVLTSKVAEAMSYYGWMNVVPAYYDVALKEKYTRDEDVTEMLEIIRSSAQMNFTFAYSTMFDPLPNIMTEFPNKSANKSIASTYESNRQKWEATLDTILETVDYE